jgi:hypothetical protein
MQCKCSIVVLQLPYRSKWNFVTFLALLFCAIVTPYEVAFLGGDTKIDGLFIINRIIDIVFLAVCALQCCLYNTPVQLASRLSLDRHHWHSCVLCTYSIESMIYNCILS